MPSIGRAISHEETVQQTRGTNINNHNLQETSQKVPKKTIAPKSRRATTWPGFLKNAKWLNKSARFTCEYILKERGELFTQQLTVLIDEHLKILEKLQIFETFSLLHFFHEKITFQK